MDRNGSGMKREWRVVWASAQVAHAGRQQDLNPCDQTQDQRNQQKAGFQIAAHRCSKKRDKDENNPSQNPYQASQDNQPLHSLQEPVTEIEEQE